MSLRKMLKVSLLMLLAMALAATSAHARLDLFGQPKPNSEEVQVLVKGSGTIPYTECINTCDICFCTRKWPPESNICICGDDSKSKKPTAAVQKVESSSSMVESEVLPYKECIKSCKHLCACTLIYPPELSTCICSDRIEPTAVKAIDEVEELHKELDLLSKPLEKSGGGFMPYPECIKKCGECVVCTKNLPIEKSWCYCDKDTTSNTNKPAIQTSGDDKQVVLWTKAKLDSIPYEECVKTCKGLCACTLPWPPELAICVCMLPIKPEAAGKAIPTDQEVAKVKSENLPFSECQKNCKMHKKCDACVICTLIYPIEKVLCYYGKDTTSKSKKPAIQNSEESHTKLDSLSKPVATSGGGFLPYPECIKKCDECVICTFIYPIERALCYCGKNTDSNSKKPAIQNSEKLDSTPYEECIQTCEQCACSIPRPPEPPICVCLSPKSAGRALPI
ncbi:hypothetical protein M0R45_028666 [Rubus argutus]|uniref:Uncharacterized protein n=1 Tax=Rubus argutus TaxID=59490 RepID=A0AAW1W5C8_RUBAR